MFKVLLEKAEDLFDGLDLIALIDANLFQAEGLNLVAELLPEFSRDDVAPADQIAFALERLRALLNRHMIGRHGGDNAGLPPKLFYINTSFERVDVQESEVDQEKRVHPRLEIYPHIYRQEYLEASYFVTHRNIPSATKFLLWRYLKSNNHIIVETTSASMDTYVGADRLPIKCADAFEQIFDEKRLNTVPLRHWQDKITPPHEPDFLHLTSYGHENDNNVENGSDPNKVTPWEALNKPVDVTLRSIAAFVVEGRVVGTNTTNNKVIPLRCLPRGIFAIESHYEDGFSDDDIHSLRIVFQGVAALIRLISHQNAPIDYRKLIAETFQQDVELVYRKNSIFSKLIYLVQKLDEDLLAELIKRIKRDKDTVKLYGIDSIHMDGIDAICKICTSPTNAAKNDRDNILQQRLIELQSILFDDDNTSKSARQQLLSEDVISFLEACPENFRWSSYLSCMAQTLGDRIAGKKLPHFRRMMPGFSASGMFMAMVDGEIRQVVKLSNATALRLEHSLYLKWVRYRIVNSARIPTNGLAFETTGEVGKNCGINDNKSTIIPPPDDSVVSSHGVLVSDLVSGGEGSDELKTFLDLVAENVRRAGINSDTGDKMNRAIQAVFGTNAILWKSIPSNENCETDHTTAVLKAFRIPRIEDDLWKDFEQDIARINELCDESIKPFSFK